MSSGNSNAGWKQWSALSPGQPKREIEAAFSNAAAGEYTALEVRIQNPITEYRVITPTS